MAKCKGCGLEARVLNDVKLNVSIEINGKPHSTNKRWTAICDDCVRDSLYYVDAGLEALSVPEPAPVLKS